MISSIRLKELAKKGIPVYAVKSCGVLKIETRDPKIGLMGNFVNWVVELNGISRRLNAHLNDIYEAKEEADFALEFQNITRTETLNLPLFNNLPEELYIPFVRFDKEENIWIAYVLYIDSDEIAILFKDINERVYDCIFQKPVTKENYLEACKIAKKLFLGEEKNGTNKSI